MLCLWTMTSILQLVTQISLSALVHYQTVCVITYVIIALLCPLLLRCTENTRCLSRRNAAEFILDKLAVIQDGVSADVKQYTFCMALQVLHLTTRSSPHSFSGTHFLLNLWVCCIDLNTSLEVGVFTSTFKTTIVKPLKQSNFDTSILTNYRPKPSNSLQIKPSLFVLKMYYWTSSENVNEAVNVGLLTVFFILELILRIKTSLTAIHTTPK